MIRKIEEQQFEWPFRKPVDTSEVADYLDVIKKINNTLELLPQGLLRRPSAAGFESHRKGRRVLVVIKEPINLSTIEKRIRQDNNSKQILFADLMLMVNNCKLFNK
jgi:hypothetical protein